MTDFGGIQVTIGPLMSAAVMPARILVVGAMLGRRVGWSDVGLALGVDARPDSLVGDADLRDPLDRRRAAPARHDDANRRAVIRRQRIAIHRVADADIVWRAT